MKNITFINRNTIKKVVVCDEETYFMERIPARPEKRNFFGTVIQKAKPFEYYTYWGSASTPEEVVEKNRKNGREVMKWIEEQAFHNTLLPIPHLLIHTGNTVAEDEMMRARFNAWKYWAGHGYSRLEYLQKHYD